MKGVLDINVGDRVLRLTVFEGDDPEKETRVFFEKNSLPMHGFFFVLPFFPRYVCWQDQLSVLFIIQSTRC